MISGQPSVTLGRILVNGFVIRQLVPCVNTNDLVGEPKGSTLVGRSMDEKFFRRHRIVDGTKRRVVKNVEPVTTDIVHLQEILGFAPTFQDPQQQSGTVVAPNV